MAGLEPVLVFWTGWGIHFMVLVSFTVQVTLLLASDFRRRKDWPVLKVIIWSAYMLADTAAIYALGHMSVVCRSPEHHLMALWAPLLLVHMGGQDNITAYAIEDNRLWLRHLQNFVLQVAAAGYVLYMSSILSHPLSKVSLAAILMFVVGVLKYGERIWALKRANSCASSSLSATSYSKAVCRTRTDGHQAHTGFSEAVRQALTLSSFWDVVLVGEIDFLDDVYSLLFIPKQMFEGPTSYVQVSNVDDKVQDGEYMFKVVKMQLSMMYDLLYTKAAVVHTWYGLVSRVISLPFTITALVMFRSSLVSDEYYSRVDVTITNVLLSGAVALETMSVLRAIFSRWTAVLLLEKEWYILASLVFVVETLVTAAMGLLLRSTTWWSGRMGQHSFFKLMHHMEYSRGRKVAKKIGVEDWWDSNAYSSSIRVSEHVIQKVLKMVSSTTIEEITKSWGQNALQRRLNNEELVTLIWTMMELKLEERILVWHIATHLYIQWYKQEHDVLWYLRKAKPAVVKAAKALANYMFFLLSARPYMLPYPVSRQAYVQLCSDAATHLYYYDTKTELLEAILNQKAALMKGTPLQPDEDIGPQPQGNEETGAAQPQPYSMTTTLDRGCQLAAKLIHITMGETEELMLPSRRKKQRKIRVDGTKEKDIMEQSRSSLTAEAVLNMVVEVWVEMLCYTAYLCNEKSHAKHLTDGGEIMTIITLLMIYMKNGLIRKDTSTSGGTTAGPSSSQGASATDTD